MVVAAETSLAFQGRKGPKICRPTSPQITEWDFDLREWTHCRCMEIRKQMRRRLPESIKQREKNYCFSRIFHLALRLPWLPLASFRMRTGGSWYFRMSKRFFQVSEARSTRHPGGLCESPRAIAGTQKMPFPHSELLVIPPGGRRGGGGYKIGGYKITLVPACRSQGCPELRVAVAGCRKLSVIVEDGAHRGFMP
jgi:hypothetical protein